MTTYFDEEILREYPLEPIGYDPRKEIQIVFANNVVKTYKYGVICELFMYFEYLKSSLWRNTEVLRLPDIDEHVFDRIVNTIYRLKSVDLPKSVDEILDILYVCNYLLPYENCWFQILCYMMDFSNDFSEAVAINFTLTADNYKPYVYYISSKYYESNSGHLAETLPGFIYRYLNNEYDQSSSNWFYKMALSKFSKSISPEMITDIFMYRFEIKLKNIHAPNMIYNPNIRIGNHKFNYVKLIERFPNIGDKLKYLHPDELKRLMGNNYDLEFQGVLENNIAVYCGLGNDIMHSAEKMFETWRGIADGIKKFQVSDLYANPIDGYEQIKKFIDIMNEPETTHIDPYLAFKIIYFRASDYYRLLSYNLVNKVLNSRIANWRRFAREYLQSCTIEINGEFLFEDAVYLDMDTAKLLLEHKFIKLEDFFGNPLFDIVRNRMIENKIKVDINIPFELLSSIIKK